MTNNKENLTVTVVEREDGQAFSSIVVQKAEHKKIIPAVVFDSSSAQALLRLVDKVNKEISL